MFNFVNIIKKLLFGIFYGNKECISLYLALFIS